MNILFLDFDGPLFPQRVFAMQENKSKEAEKIVSELGLHQFINYWKMDEIAVNMLNNLYDISNFSIVVSSSWAELCEKEAIENLFVKNKIKINLHTDWMTPRNRFNNRAQEIAAWLVNNDYKNYIILDDNISGTGLILDDDILESGLDKNKIFLINEEDGIDWRTYQDIIQIIKGW